MLKGIVSGSPVDIKRIAMKGKNLWNPVPNASAGYNLEPGTIISTTAGLLQATMNGDDLLLTASASWATTAWMIPVDNSSPMTIKYKTSSSSARMTVYVADNEYKITRKCGNYSGAINTEIHVTPDISIGDTYIVVSMSLNSATTAAINTPIINYGQNALPYEPYGMQPGWEVRDQQGTILWGADKTLTGTDSISFKGYALPLKSYEIEANMEQAATQVYTIEGTSSIDYQSDGTAIALQIVGNETQSGTPTPTVPITPQECGDKTANLWNEQYPSIEIALRYVSIYVGDGEFTLSTNCPIGDGLYPCLFFLTGQATSGASTGTNDVRLGVSRTVTATDGYVTIAYRGYSDVSPVDYETMLNTGGTALDYEPFGYKITLTQ